MNQKSIIKAIRSRLKYIEAVKGLPACDAKNTSELVDVFMSDAKEISKLRDCSTKSHDEMQRLVIEACANLIYMSQVFGNPPSVMDFLKEDHWPNFPTQPWPGLKPSMFDKIYGCDFAQSHAAGGRVGDPIPVEKKVEGHMPIKASTESLNEAMRKLGESIVGKPLPPMSKKVSDGALKKNEYNTLPLGQKILIKNICGSDPACTNGLTRIITEFGCPEIVEDLHKMNIRGRAQCLGFLAKLCKYDIVRMQAVIHSWKEGHISEFDIKSECVDSRGKRFNIEHMTDQYKELKGIK